MELRVSIQQMTTAQKHIVRDADPRRINCVAEGVEGKMEGLVNVAKRKGVYGTMARTGRVFENAKEAIAAAEAIVNELRGQTAPAPDPEPKTKPKKTRKTSKKKKKA